jgi:hypothetical protein
MANKIISHINENLRLPIHNLGIIKHYNGIGIEQTHHFVKLHCSKYLMKIRQNCKWINDSPVVHRPLPFPSDKTALAKLLQCPNPQTDEDKLEDSSGMSLDLGV